MFRLSVNNFVIAFFLVAIAVLFRIIPHPANFAPVGAIALVSGFLMARRYAIWLPVLIMAVSDMIIGTHPLILWTWGSFALIALLSSTFLSKRNIGAGTVTVAALSSGVLFFVITNFGVWLQSGMYIHNMAGLVQCYYNALPFFRNTLLSDVFFSASIYASYLIVKDVKFKNFKLHQATK